MTVALIVLAVVLYLPVGWYAIGAVNCVDGWLDREVPQPLREGPRIPLGKVAVVFWPVPCFSMLLMALVFATGFVVFGPIFWLLDLADKHDKAKPPRPPPTGFRRWLASGPRLCRGADSERVR